VFSEVTDVTVSMWVMSRGDYLNNLAAIAAGGDSTPNTPSAPWDYECLPHRCNDSVSCEAVQLYCDTVAHSEH